MALTTAQNLALKKHLGLHPTETIIDPFIQTLVDAGSDNEAELVDAIAACDTAETAIDTAEAATDDLTEGGGARFNYAQVVAMREKTYRRKVADLCRLIGWPCPEPGGQIQGVVRY